MTFPILGGNSAVAGGYSIDNSLRFNKGDSPYLSRTPSSAGNRKTWTWSGWVKNVLGTNGFSILRCWQDDSNLTGLTLDSNGQFSYIDRIANSNQFYLNTTPLLRDPSAWYHFTFVSDTTQATASNRFKFYVNGVQITNFDSSTYPSQNFETRINNTVSHKINILEETGGSGTQYSDGYLAEVHFIDGQALSPTDFGEFDEDSGIWKPIEYTGSYGTNGFYLDFENSGSLGADQSGNGNNFTPTNLASTDQTTDTPTNNFATLNALQVTNSDIALSEGNLKQVITNNWKYTPATFGASSGKWYAEIKLTDASNFVVGVMQLGGASDTTSLMNTNNTILGSNGAGDAWSLYGSTIEVGTYKNDNTPNFGNLASNFVGNWSNNDICMIALDTDNQKIWFGRNGSWDNSGDPSAGTNPMPVNTAMIAGETFTFAGGGENNTNLWNFGSPPYTISSGNSDDNGYGNFEYAPPSGYLALCTQNLATALSPTIDDGSAYFQTALYTGNGTAIGSGGLTITNDGNSDLQPDFIWFKKRSGAESHAVGDSTRGGLGLFPDLTQGESSGGGQFIDSFNTDGFTVGNVGWVNDSGQTYVAWQLKASGGTTSSNTDGSITSTVQANTTAGFSIVTYTGTGSAGATIGHSLGKVPKIIIVKNRDGGYNWRVYESKGGATKFLSLNLTTAQQSGTTLWNNTEPTSSVVTLGSDESINENGSSIIAYCFAEIEGYSKFGSYTGNGSTDGTFVYTGFRPAFVIYKRTDSTGNWGMLDSTRSPFNVADDWLASNLSSQETVETNRDADFLSNGFKPNGTNNDVNASGGTYIYMAFAENPFATSTGVPVTAR